MGEPCEGSLVAGGVLRDKHDGAERGRQRIQSGLRSEDQGGATAEGRHPSAMTSTTKAVRQVLMNELGLTRESVREVVRAVVKEEIAALLKNDQAMAARVAVGLVKDYHFRESVAARVASRVKVLVSDAPPVGS